MRRKRTTVILSAVLPSRPFSAHSHPCTVCLTFNLFIGENSSIGMEGWAALARVLSSQRNVKKLVLGEWRGNESFDLIDNRIILPYSS